MLRMLDIEYERSTTKAIWLTFNPSSAAALASFACAASERFLTGCFFAAVFLAGFFVAFFFTVRATLFFAESFLGVLAAVACFFAGCFFRAVFLLGVRPAAIWLSFAQR